ncbi:HlyD family type I secretion periplasmic adaptor subunit [Hwanghaeella grinnelliae]|uniref:Membrane fusion protein (MFP) family protein n=1 Tax=Hwanghaeella grinnelliae TaxID=2500179 RepID=A0A3S2W3F6_9PROT|nr:HlyD family type I secretion periplasmic adaptor subunit [Hwanghaeella grinnelliae]RVU35104.1 HlyD family type I secretion periplasmic adaptor subunit [Hwanghaeella grinnelliae]
MASTQPAAKITPLGGNLQPVQGPRKDNSVHFGAGEYLFFEGEDSDVAYLIRSGTVWLTKDTGKGEVHLRRIHAGELFGEMGIIDGKPRSASAYAETDVVVERFAVSEFLARMEQDPQFALDLVNRLIGNLRETNDRMAHQYFLKSQLENKVRGGDMGETPTPLRKRLSPIGAMRRFFSSSDDLSEFRPDAVELEQSRFPMIAKVTLYLIVGFFLSVLTWASFAEIDTAVIAPGRVAPAVPNILVQPVETAVVLGIEVKEGDIVEEGQLLATLDATFAEADLQASRSSLISIAAEERRLTAELAASDPESFSPVPAIDLLQREIFDRRRAEYVATLSSWNERISQLEADLVINRQDAADMAEQVEVLREIEGMRIKLMNDGYGSRVQFLVAKNQRLSVEREQRRLLSVRQRLIHEREAARQDREAYTSNHRSQIAQQLAATRRQRQEMEERLKKSERRESLVSLTAPARGIVLDIADRSAGSVVQQAEPFFTIVPLDVELQMEASVAPKDVGQIKVGDPVRIKLDALPFQKFGSLQGTVLLISEDTVKAEDGKSEPTYRTKVEITDHDLRSVPANFRLIPGMTGTAEITVGKRKVISYFVYPIARALDNSFKEP